MLKSFITFLFLSSFCTGLVAQNDDLNALIEKETEQKPVKNFTRATFKTTRIVNGHSIENTSGGVLDFRITHHFGTVEQGLYDMFGLDKATMRMSLEYGLNNRWMIGLGRSTYEKTIDGFTKFKILRQSEEKGIMPVSLSYFGSVELKTISFENPDRKNYFSSRLYFNHQLLLARKFSDRFSFQISPTLVHWNLVPRADDPNDMLALGAGGRYKLSKRVSVNLEYFYQIPGYKLINTQDAIALGFDIETGGHVFQVFVTNSIGITERAFITQTTGDWMKGEVLLGFCISRVFTLRSPESFR